MQQSNQYAYNTIQLMKKISDYRSRYQPLELQLQKNGGLYKQIYDKDEKGKTIIKQEQISVKGIGSLKNNMNQSMKRTNDFRLQSQIPQIDHDGLISEFVFIQNEARRNEALANLQEYRQEYKHQLEEFCNDNKIKVMICITMYSEPLQELKKSLEGIQDSLNEFSEKDIMPNQILVVVIFDGIENIRNQGDENGNNDEGDIIPYFCQYLDKQNNIEELKSLEYQYKIYKLKKERIQKYSLEQRKLFQQKTDSQKKQYLMNDKYLNKRIIYKQGNEFNFEDVVRTMEQKYLQAKQYIECRQNNAWVYQSVQTVKLKDNIESQLPIFHVFKFANGTKLSSHLWFFKGFCHEFQPEYCVLMDCGAKPHKGSISNLINELRENDQVGGVCGTMSIELSKSDDQKGEYMDIITKFLNTGIFNIERCQKCEYDIGNLLDKQFESALNFIQVLPGAYSAYRYKAFSTKYQANKNTTNNNDQSQIAFDNLELRNQIIENILDYYLKSKLDPNYEHATLEEANMFLAEDRVLCLLLFCNGYYLRYVRNALVDVDPLQNIIQLLLQRRRWINGSWFALNYVVKKYRDQLPLSGHSTFDKSLFILCLVFARISQMLQYFVITFQIVWLYMILKTVTDDSDPAIASAIKQIVIGAYVFLEFSLIYLSLNYNSSSVNMSQRKEEKEKERKQINQYYYSKFYGISTILGLLSLANAGYTIYLIIIEFLIKQSPFRLFTLPQDLPSYIYFIVLISFILTVLPFILQLFIDCKLVFEIAINSIHYIYYMPTYTHLFITYSFCRIDDLTWGTKGLTSDVENKDQCNKESDKKYQKYKFLIKWIGSNVIVTIIFYILFYLEIQNILVIIILSFGVMFCILQFAKFIGFFKYWISFICSRKTNNRVHNQKNNNGQPKDKFVRNREYKEHTKLIYRLNNQEEGQTSISLNP